MMKWVKYSDYCIYTEGYFITKYYISGVAHYVVYLGTTGSKESKRLGMFKSAQEAKEYVVLQK